MASALNTRPVLTRVLERFPEHAPLIRRRFLMDASFRGACEDYHLAHEGLEANAQRGNGAATHLDEYRRLVRELEQEVSSMLHGRRGNAP